MNNSNHYSTIERLQNLYSWEELYRISGNYNQQQNVANEIVDLKEKLNFQ